MQGQTRATDTEIKILYKTISHSQNENVSNSDLHRKLKSFNINFISTIFRL